MPIPSPVAARVAAVILSLAAAYVALRVYPQELPAPERRPDFLSTVFHSRAIVFTGRITILCVAAFVVLSIAARIWSREWLTKAGPFEVAAVSERERDDLKREIADALSEFARLTATTRSLVTERLAGFDDVTRRQHHETRS